MKEILSKILSKEIIKKNNSKEILKGTAIALLVKIFAAGFAFLMNIVIARNLGTDEAGLFFLGFTLVLVISTLTRMGLDNSIIRFVSAESSKGNASGVHGAYRKAVTWVAVLSAVTASTILFFNEKITKYVFQQDGFGDVLTAIIFAVPLVALYTLHAQALQGLRLIAKAMMTLNASVPIIVLTFLSLFSVNTAKDTAWVFVAACGITLLLGYTWWTLSSPKSTSPPSFSSQVLLRSCLPLWGVAFFSQAFQWSSQILLGIWSTTTDVALFASAQRTALLTSFLLIAVNSITAPKFAALHSQGDMAALRRTALISVRIMLSAALPVFLFITIFSEWLMGLFGSDFKGASNILLILATGQFVNIATGSVGFLLSMTGHERQLRLNVFIATILGVGLGIILIPIYGITGGAIATAIAVASQNLLGVYQVNKFLGFNTLAFWHKI